MFFKIQISLPLTGRFSKLKELVLSLNKVLKESKNQVKELTLNRGFFANSFMRTATSLKIFKILDWGSFDFENIIELQPPVSAILKIFKALESEVV